MAERSGRSEEAEAGTNKENNYKAGTENFQSPLYNYLGFSLLKMYLTARAAMLPRRATAAAIKSTDLKYPGWVL